MSYKDVLAQLSPPHTPIPLLASASPSPLHPKLCTAIAALEVHPALEALLHILNGDLSSAHFLTRHMESPPAFEGMTMHALLHRVEGDIENARCWYFDVMDADVFKYAWLSDATDPSAHLTNGGQSEGDHAGPTINSKMSDYKSGKSKYASKPEAARDLAPAQITEFLDRIQTLRRHTIKPSANPLQVGASRETETSELSAMSAREIERLRTWCETKFGTEKWTDARSEYVGVGEQRGEISDKKSAMLVGGEGFRKF